MFLESKIWDDPKVTNKKCYLTCNMISKVDFGSVTVQPNSLAF